MNNKTRLTELTDFFYYIEDKYELFNYKINDVYFWKLLRFSLYSDIANKLGMIELNSSKPKTDYSIINKIKYYMQILKREYYTLRFNALKIKNNKDILIFRSSRKQNINGKKVDIYTSYLEVLNEFYNQTNFEFVEYDAIEEYSFSNSETYIAARTLISSKINYLIKEIKLHGEENILIKNLSNEIKLKFDLNIDILSKTKKSISYFKYFYQYYNRLFKKLKVKNIFLVCSYGKEAIIAAAKDNKIRVTELQHGTISKHHMGYSFSNKYMIPYFPDKFLVFGHYWSEVIEKILPKENIKVIGYQYLNVQLEKYSSYKKKEKTVLFLSQWTIGEQLSRIAFDFAKEYKEYNIIYKLHPAEYVNWKDKYSFLEKAVKLNNFRLIKDNNEKLHYLMAISEYQVGVYSTAIYEGIELQCKTVLVNLFGLEYMDLLIENNLVKVVSNADELFEAVNNFNCSSVKSDYFFDKNVNTNIIIKGILANEKQ